MAALQEHILHCYNEIKNIFRISGVLLLSPDDHSFDRSYIYVADPDTAVSILSTLSLGDNGILLFLSGDHPDLEALCRRTGASVCITDLPLIQLHNLLARALARYASWHSRLKAGGDRSLQSLISNASQISSSAILFLSSQHQHIASSVRPEYTKYISNLLDYNQGLTPESYKMLSPVLEENASFFDAVLEDGALLCALPLCSEKNVLGYLLMISRNDPATCKEFVLQLSFCIIRILTSNNVLSEGKVAFQSLAQDIFSTTPPQNLEALQMRLQGLQRKPKKYMRSILIRPQKKEEADMEQMLAEAERIFPTENAALLGSDLLILVSSNYNVCPLPCDKDAFERFLVSYDAHAMIANPAKVVKSLRIMYLQCLRVFDAALKVQYNINSRQFYYERFSIYYIISLCAQCLSDVQGNDDLVYLCHPGVLALTRYDRTYNSDLRDVLFEYLCNRCSISRTAQSMYMHRNTVIYKINKIEEILGEPMDDPHLRHSLLFSCMIIRYREKVQGEHIQLAAFEPTTP